MAVHTPRTKQTYDRLEEQSAMEAQQRFESIAPLLEESPVVPRRRAKALLDVSAQHTPGRNPMLHQQHHHHSPATKKKIGMTPDKRFSMASDDGVQLQLHEASPSGIFRQLKLSSPRTPKMQVFRSGLLSSGRPSSFSSITKARQLMTSSSPAMTSGTPLRNVTSTSEESGWTPIQNNTSNGFLANNTPGRPFADFMPQDMCTPLKGGDDAGTTTTPALTNSPIITKFTLHDF